MNIKLLDVLACPKCKGRLWIDAQLAFVKVDDGDMVCEKCGAKYPISGGIPRFVKSDGYVRSFSLEWARHARTQLDSVSGLHVAEDTFFERTGFTELDIKGKLVLDAGCGIGRFMEVAQKHGAHIVGVDMSYSVNQTYENVGKLPNVDIVQADLMNLPFRPGVFDTAFSIGVLHHTSNAEQAFKNVAALVKDNGKLAVWLYANDGLRQRLYNAVAAFYRTFTTRMPQDKLYEVCKCAIPLYEWHRSPFGFLTRAIMPTSIEPIPEWRVPDTFDWYSPKYQSKHTYRQVESWFIKTGFVNVRRLSFPTSVTGLKGD